MSDKDYTEYGESEHGNFKIIDTLVVPHHYCITPRHVELAANDFNGILGQAAMEEADRKGIKCGIRNCNLSYKEHKQVLLVSCKVDIDENEELHKYLLNIKEIVDRKGFAGFAFKDFGMDKKEGDIK